MYLHVAAQMWLLGRLLPCMVGFCVPCHDKCWINYLKLLEIVDLLLGPEITEDEVAYLDVLIREHHSTFIEVYPAVRVIPKHHFMIHMPKLILR